MAIQSFQKAQETDSQPFTLYRSGGREYHGFFSNIRIDRETVPEGWHVYDFREGEEDEHGNTPLLGQLKNGYVMVNHMGTFATKEDIGLPEGDSLWFCGEEEYVDQLGIMNDEFDYDFDEPAEWNRG